MLVSEVLRGRKALAPPVLAFAVQSPDGDVGVAIAEGVSEADAELMEASMIHEMDRHGRDTAWRVSVQ